MHNLAHEQALECPPRIRQQLKLSEDELEGIIGCTLGREDYVAILKAKKLI